MTIYVTYLTVYNGNLMPKFYIGSTSLEKINNGYHGSVSSFLYKKIWKTELKEHPKLFKTYVITKHETRKQAIEKEAYFHEALKVHHNNLYINMMTARGNFGLLGPCSPDKKKKMSESRKKYFKENPKAKQLLSENRKKYLSENPLSIRTKTKISNSLKDHYKHNGIPEVSSITKEKISHKIKLAWEKRRLEGKNHLSIKRKHKPMTDEHKKKLSQKAKEYHQKLKQT